MARHHGNMHRVVPGGDNVLRPATMVAVLGKVDAFRRPERFEQLLLSLIHI